MQVIINFFSLLLDGVQAIMQFMTQLPEIFALCVQAFPPALSVYLLAGFALIVAIRVLELLP